MGEFCLLLLTGFRVQFQKFTQSEEYGAMQCNIEWLEHQFLDVDVDGNNRKTCVIFCRNLECYAVDSYFRVE